MLEKAGEIVDDVADENTLVFTGSCTCKAIGYSAESLRPLWYCHCRQCRNMTGHFMAAAQADLDKITITGEPKWYYVSDTARHGFCQNCGSQLFWRDDTKPYLSITGGSLDDTSKLQVGGHIYTAEKGHYYELLPEEKQYASWHDPNPAPNSDADNGVEKQNHCN